VGVIRVGRRALMLGALAGRAIRALAQPDARTSAAQAGAAPAATVSNAVISAILAERIDVGRCSRGFVAGLRDQDAWQLVTYGSSDTPACDTPNGRRPDGDTVLEIGSVTKVFTA
jgi:CubicO group peptidase (beta-lactamase class C family)